MVRTASLVATLSLSLAYGSAAAQQRVSFQRDVAPILAARCTGCHQPAKRKGDLDLASYRGLLQGGAKGPAIVAGKPDESLLLRLVRGPDASMPATGKPLSTEQITTLERWIREGGHDDTNAAEVATTRARASYPSAPPVPSIRYSPDGSLLAVAGYHEVLLHDADAHAIVGRLVGRSPRVESIAFSKDGRLLAAAGGAPGRFGEVQLWNVASRKLEKSWRVSTDTVYGVCFSPDAKTLAFGCADKTVRAIRVADGKEILLFKNHAEWVLGTTFSVNGQQLVSASRDKALKIIDLANGRFVDDINSPIERALCLARHPTKDIVVFGGDLGTPRVYRISDNQKRTAARNDTNLVRALARQRGPVYAVAFSPDGKAIAAGGADRGVHVHDAGSGKRITELRGHQGAVFTVAFHPKRNRITTAGFDGKLRTYDRANGKLLQESPAVPVGARAERLFATLEVEPQALTLRNGRDERRVLVTARTPDGRTIDVTDEAIVTTDSPHLAIRDDGYIRPKARGKGIAWVAAGGLRVPVHVHVQSATTPPAHFTKDVMPILSRLGCNAGTCHGAQDGKNGFALSLRGFDPRTDHEALTRDLGGRRFDRVAPEHSLMLLKPLAAIAHEGGAVLDRSSRHYDILLQWIREGTRFANDETSRIVRLEVQPSAIAIALAGEQRRVLVEAHYADGSSRDVTRDAILSSSDTEVATVRDDTITSLRRGEASLLVRYEGAYATASITTMGKRDGFAWRDVERFNFIDEHVQSKLKRVKTLPSQMCTDEEFLRRAFLDLTGKPPTAAEAIDFCSDAAPSREKRRHLIDRLIGSEAFVAYWSNKWADLLQCNSKTLGERGVWIFRNWLSRAIAENRPYDRFVRELITASGSTYEQPAANYMRALTARGRKPDAAKMTEDVTQTFLGVRFSCNKCHNHPFERWTQQQYYEFSAHFARVRFKNGREPGELVVYESYSGGEAKHPRSGDDVAPRVPFDAADANGSLDDRRAELATWLTSKDNAMFARSYVNRVWSYFFGRGIIEPVDDIRAGNPPTNPALLDALEKSFVDSGFDFRKLVRTICESRTYQTSFRTNRWNADDKINFSHFVPRRLSAEQLLDAVALAAGVRPQLPGLPEGSRAVEAPDGVVKGNDFLKLFGRPKRESACECARTNNISLSHALNLVGGRTIHDAVVDPKGRVAKLVASERDDLLVVRELYWAALGREPTAREALTFADLGPQETRLAAAQDLFWALLNSPAFLFTR